MRLPVLAGHRVYICGSTADAPACREKFEAAAARLVSCGALVLHRAWLPDGLDRDDYLSIGYIMLGCCDTIYMLSGWTDSPEARQEHIYAAGLGLRILFQAQEG